MAIPSEKSPEVEDLIDAANPSGRTRFASIVAGVCSFCGKPATEFHDELSRKEYSISGLCQECQDSVFGA